MMTPRFMNKRCGACFCFFALILGFSCVASAQQPPSVTSPGRDGSPQITDAIAAARATSPAVTTNANLATGTRPALPDSVTQNPNAQKMRDYVRDVQMSAMARQQGRNGKPATVVSNGVAVIPEALVASPEQPISSDPMVAVQQINTRWTEKQHNLIYSDPEAKTLNDEIKRLEKEILEKRQVLAAKLAANPEMAKINEERMKAYQALANLRQAANRAATATQP
jgi:hypothetical protein